MLREGLRSPLLNTALISIFLTLNFYLNYVRYRRLLFLITYFRKHSRPYRTHA